MMSGKATSQPDDPQNRPEFSTTEDAVDEYLDNPDDVLAEHDPTGIDLATQIAHLTAATGGVKLPPVKARRPRPQRTTEQTFSSSRPDDRDPTLLGSAFDDLIKQRGWTREVSVRMLLNNWPQLVGEANAQHSTPEKYVDGVLTVRTDSTAWATSLRTMVRRLVAELNNQLGDGTVTRIEVMGPVAPSWKHGPRSVRDGRGPRDTYG